MLSIAVPAPNRAQRAATFTIWYTRVITQARHDSEAWRLDFPIWRNAAYCLHNRNVLWVCDTRSVRLRSRDSFANCEPIKVQNSSVSQLRWRSDCFITHHNEHTKQLTLSRHFLCQFWSNGERHCFRRFSLDSTKRRILHERKWRKNIIYGNPVIIFNFMMLNTAHPVRRERWEGSLFGIWIFFIRIRDSLQKYKMSVHGPIIHSRSR